MTTIAKGYKDFTSDDITFVRDTLHEAIPITGSIVSGTYDSGDGTEYNIKNVASDLFQSVYDYPYLSSSANHILDITIGYPTVMSKSSEAPSDGESPSKGYGPIVGNSRKMNIYNEMAQVCMGFDETGSVRRFDRDGMLTGGEKIEEAFFVNFTRLLTKDEIKKQSFTMQLLTGGAHAGAGQRSPGGDAGDGNLPLLTIQDHGAKSNYRTNAVIGEYGILYTSSAGPQAEALGGDGPAGVGLIFYQAGIAVISSSVFSVQGEPNGAYNVALPGGRNTNSIPSSSEYLGGCHPGVPAYGTVRDLFASSSISGAADAFRNRLYNVSFNNTIDINSTVYFCRANHSEFNYSSNPTYLSQSKIVVKDLPSELSRTYITTVGLYSSDNELLAVAKLSQPIEKSWKNSLMFQVRLDF